MRSELYHVLRDRSFVKSPTLSKLLAYLVFETLSGNGDKLKSYTVAVDCLGKSADFDAKSDSYPRVQAMRLRKLLEAFYAKHVPLDGLCLYMVAGSYRVRMASPETAYPDLFRPLSPARPPTKAETDETPDQGEAPATVAPAIATDTGDKSQFAFASIFAFAFAFTMLFAAAYFWMNDSAQTAAKSTGKAAAVQVPVIFVSSVESSNDAAAIALAEDIFAKLVDGMGRSWAVRVRLPIGGDEAQRVNATGYRLEARLGEVREGSRPLYLRLTENGSSDLIWSAAPFIDPAKSLQDNLGSSISQLSSPFGVIARREAERLKADQASGYACLLRYVTYVRSQYVSERPVSNKCLGEPIADSRMDAVRLAVRSFFVMETSTPENREARMVKARSYAAQSVVADPQEAYAHFAEARLHYQMSECAAGNTHTLHALKANPYDPVLLTILGNFAAECGLPEAEALVQRAFDLRTPGETFSRLSLILASIRDGRKDRLIALSSNSSDGTKFSPAYYHLCETLIAAELGKPELARDHWQKLNRIIGKNLSPEDVLSRIILAPQLRQRIIAYLGTKGVLNSAPAPRIGDVTSVNAS